jgi:simple sugar transport system ATP-binding protein
LSAGVKQRIELLKALAADARILLLDEPSSVLSPADATRFLEEIQAFKARGLSTVLITHKFSEALSVADRVTVLRRGRVVHHGLISATNAEELSRSILGEAPTAAAPRVHTMPGEVRVQAEDLAVTRMGSGGTGLRRATLTVRAGEVIGVAAVEGNGQRELLRAIAGLAPIASGRLTVHGRAVLIPEDRTSEALIGEFSLAENLVLSQGRDAPWVHGPWIDWATARARASDLMQEFGVRAPGSEALAQGLSGGNQQRMVIAAALERRPKVLVAENPTRGLDFRATNEVHARLRAAAAQGVAVLVHLADLDELMLLADRIVVLASGTAQEMAADATRDAIGRQMLDGQR